MKAGDVRQRQLGFALADPDDAFMVSGSSRDRGRDRDAQGRRARLASAGEGADGVEGDVGGEGEEGHGDQP